MAAYSKATFEEIHRPHLHTLHRVDIRHFETSILLNRGKKFEIQALPFEAQISPCSGISAADFNGDGNLDLFLSQNFFAVHPDTSRYDAGLGLLLTNTGKAIFHPVAARDSGIRIYGEQRGAAASDYDHDGRMDLLVAQNAGAIKLYKNQNSTPAFQIIVRGPAENPTGLGATMTLPNGMRTELTSSQTILVSAVFAGKDLTFKSPKGSTSTLKLPASPGTAITVSLQ